MKGLMRVSTYLFILAWLVSCAAPAAPAPAAAPPTQVQNQPSVAPPPARTPRETRTPGPVRETQTAAALKAASKATDAPTATTEPAATDTPAPATPLPPTAAAAPVIPATGSDQLSLLRDKIKHIIVIMQETVRLTRTLAPTPAPTAFPCRTVYQRSASMTLRPTNA
jgi:hypothetical protein